MKKSFSAFLAAVILLLVTLTGAGCAKVTEKLDELFPEETETTADQIDPFKASLPDRIGRTYTVLLSVQAENAEELTTVSLLTFHTEDQTIHWLQLPADLFVNTTGTNLAGVFANTYRTEMATQGGTPDSAAAKSAAAIGNLLAQGYTIPVDYYVNFDPDQLKALVTTLQGIPIHLPVRVGSFAAGEQVLNADDVKRYLTADSSTGATEELMNARKYFAHALWEQARTIITAENLSLYSTELRGEMTTDIPYTGGEDIFFLRRFLQAEPDRVCITHVSSQIVVQNGVRCSVLMRANAHRQLNEQMLIYEDALTDEQFDPMAVFMDPGDQLVKTVYYSTASLPKLYTMAEIAEGAVELQ